MKKKISLLLITALIIVTFAGCKTSSPVSKTGFYFDTVVTISLYDGPSALIDDCFEICQHYDDLFNKTKEGSDIYNINHFATRDKAVTVSPETLELLELAKEYSDLSDGSFSLNCGSLTALWNYSDENPKVPSQTDIEAALKSVKEEALILDKNSVYRTSESLQVDAGAIAKGYIADKLKAFLLENDVKRALINLGGNIVCINASEKESFTIGIQEPFSTDGSSITTVCLSNGSVVTSGTYQRYFTGENGEIYHHIIDLNTGYPCNNDLNSVTIICDSSTQADALSTTVFLMGIEKGKEFVEASEGIEAIFIDKENNVIKTSGLK